MSLLSNAKNFGGIPERSHGNVLSCCPKQHAAWEDKNVTVEMPVPVLEVTSVTHRPVEAFGGYLQYRSFPPAAQVSHADPSDHAGNFL
jgi:hypothetical protein